MGEHNFYYDESEHSRKINLRTITADNYYDNFITAIVGWDVQDEGIISERYFDFEEKYARRKSGGELKSTTIKQSQFERGFASLNNVNISLIDDFLSLFSERVFVYYSVASKTEYIINQLFKDYENSLFEDMDALKYSITKAIVLYQPKEVIEGLYGDTNELVSLLKSFFSAQIEQDKANETLKELEIEQFSQILMLLEDASTIGTLNWNYDISFVGFREYLSEKSIESYSLVIDKEGKDGNTAKAAERVGLRNVTEADSLSFFGIRMADMLVGLISKLHKALSSALEYASPQEKIRKKILDKSWFEINERQLALYKKLHSVLIELNKAWYKAFAGHYSDDLITFTALMGYMNHFESVDEIKSNIEMQGEYFNGYVCESMSIHYRRTRSKLPIDFIGDTAKDFFFNRKEQKSSLMSISNHS